MCEHWLTDHTAKDSVICSVISLLSMQPHGPLSRACVKAYNTGGLNEELRVSSEASGDDSLEYTSLTDAGLVYGLSFFFYTCHGPPPGSPFFRVRAIFWQSEFLGSKIRIFGLKNPNFDQFGLKNPNF